MDSLLLLGLFERLRKVLTPFCILHSMDWPGHSTQSVSQLLTTKKGLRDWNFPLFIEDTDCRYKPRKMYHGHASRPGEFMAAERNQTLSVSK